MRLVDADALIEYLKDEICKINSSMEDALQIEAFAIRANLKAKKSELEDIIYVIEHGPSIDAVPVIRCKDCKNYWKNNEDYLDRTDEVCFAPAEDFFCAEGKRKES